MDKQTKPLIKILSRENQASNDVIIDESLSDKNKVDLKKFCVFCQKAVSNMSSQNKGLAHQNNVYNSEPIFQKEDIIITRKHFLALETEEQWLSNSVR